jgi:hypothetical protein
VAAAGEVRDPASPLVGVGSGSVLVAAAVPPAGVRPAPAANVTRRGAAAGTAGRRRGGAFLGGGLLGGPLPLKYLSLLNLSRAGFLLLRSCSFLSLISEELDVYPFLLSTLTSVGLNVYSYL